MSDTFDYKLYLMRLNEENFNAVQDKRFYRIKSDYILLYERGQRTTNYNEIGESELKYLSSEDKQWLLDCIFAIYAEETMKHESDIASRMGAMLDKLEHALKEEEAKELKSNERNENPEPES